MRYWLRRPLGATLVAAAIVLGGGGIYVATTPSGGGGGGGPAPVGAANLWVDPSGGTCTRQVTAGGYVDAQACTSLSAADSAATSGDTVRVTAGSYGGQSLSQTAKTVTFIGAGETSILNSVTLGATSGGVSNNFASNKTVDGFRIGTITMFGGAGNTIKNAHVVGPSDNAILYAEGPQNLTVDTVDFDGTVNPPIDDLVDFFEQSRAPQTDGVTIVNSKVHHARASTSGSHPDGLQFCNCDSVAGNSKYARNITLARNKFYDNECPNVRFNTNNFGLVENNYFENGISSGGISSCPANATYQADTGAFTGTLRYNTFAGSDCIQGTGKSGPNPEPNHAQTWIGNMGTCFVGGSSGGCSGAGGGSTTGTFSHNIWVGLSCGASDISVASNGARLLSAGVPQPSSPGINAGDSAVFPTVDFLGVARPIGGTPDIGAYEVG